jgi:ribonucleoside-triphosphate reductase (thioredoxin)
MKDVSVGILSDLTVHMKYARHIPEIARRETWDELCDRNVAMHIKRYPQLKEEIKQVYKDFVRTKKVLPSMRSLQFGGTPIELSESRIFNCAFLPLDHQAAFSEAMFLLLGGTGVGYSVQARHVNKLPSLTEPAPGTYRFLVGDSIEGWADAVKILLKAYFNGKSLPRFDFSGIRAKGARLITSGGKAPGPKPLKDCLDRLQAVLERALTRGTGTRLRPIEAHDMLCHIADAVLAGGIRRAAMIVLFDRADEEMLTCKSNLACTLQRTDLVNQEAELYECDITTTMNGKEYHNVILHSSQLAEWKAKGALPWYLFEPQRGRANNSANLPRGQVTQEEFTKLMERVEASGAGEPGVYWTNNLDWGTNPCCEIGLRPNQFCNLTEINADDLVDQEDLEKRAGAAAFIGTLQAGYTDFHYLRPIWRETTEKDALIGVGITGIGSGAILDLDLEAAARVVKSVNGNIAQLININPAARTSTVKPAGTTSLVLGSASGVHAWHAPYYVRRIRVGKNEAIYKYLAEHHPELVEDEYFRPQDQAVITIPQKAPAGAILRSESPAELLDRVRRFNLEWVRAGHRDGDNTHNVSCTISVKDDEWGIVSGWMWENREHFNGISVLPYDGGTYIQAPFEDITEERYLELIGTLTAVDLTRVVESDDNTDLTGEIACGAGGCEVK